MSNAAALTSPVKLPVTLPVKSPEKPLVAVITPDAETLVSEMLSSRLMVTVSFAADEVRLVPPAIVRVSERRLMLSEPLSPATVKSVDTVAIPAAVRRPLLSTVNVGISEEEP